MRALQVRAVLLGLAFAIILGASLSFMTSPWSIVAGAVIGFGFGLLAAWRPRLGWTVWLLTAPAMAGLIWFGVEQCLATTPGDDCSVAWMIFFGWLVPWSIGIVVLGVHAFVARRPERAGPGPRLGIPEGIGRGGGI